ncbi:MAG: FAD-dependent oxidoreductase [Gammaproteobacteria bacterium]|nr:MAG: FAD-dependent oxidoreductase [Gammaproteobacteria bacterium]
MTYDLIIIGGGIHGAACARLCADSGYKVLVLEQYAQPGLATSSKSSKLIHGGLRYLESGQFRLVRECLLERDYLLKEYPELVKFVPFHIPVYAHTRRPPWIIRLGLLIYSLFSGKGFSTIKKSHWQELDQLKTDQLKTVFQYYDAQTNDQLLTQAVMQDAQALGAELITEARFHSARCDANACHVRYEHENATREVTGKLLINTSGPWVNQVLQAIEPRPSMLEIELVLGTHIEIARPLHHGMYYLEAPQDQRAVFVMPWQNNTLIGTTETLFHDIPENTSPPAADIEYLLSVYNHYFSPAITPADIVNSFAGLRVLPAARDSAFHRPRDTIIHHDNRDNPRVFSLYGGKLTAHRATARQLLRCIQPLLG